jgi:hypothetical protein
MGDSMLGLERWGRMLLLTALFLSASAAAVSAQPTAKAKRPLDFVPAGYKILQEVMGDLNKDSLEDCVLLIVGKKDESRCGIVIVFNKGEYYENMLENRNIFSYEKSDFAFFFAPSAEIAITKGVLNINTTFRHGAGAIYYMHSYKFRYQNSDFELIGYDYSHHEPATLCSRSINLLSKKMHGKCVDVDGEGKVFDEEWKNITIKKPIILRKIVSLDEMSESAFNLYDYITVK